MELGFMAHLTGQNLLFALGLAIALEAALWTFLPDTMRKTMQELANMSVDGLRTASLIGLAIGVALMWAAKG